jgi:predicted alpha/beta superfamily hydrolase
VCFLRGNIHSGCLCAAGFACRGGYFALAKPFAFETFTGLSLPVEAHYRIYLAVPRQPPPPAGYPVFYLLDGNAVLDALHTEAVVLEKLAASPDAPLLVMIGYDTPSRFDVVARAHDYTPPVPGEADLTDMPDSGRKAGGAEIFRDFLVHRLKPELQQRFNLFSSVDLM